METGTAIFVIGSLSAFFDLKIRKIPNWLIACGLLWGMALNALQGYAHLFASVAGFIVGVGVLFFPFAMGWIGAGDVKFFGVVGALVGIWMLPRVFFYSAVVAGIIAIGYLAACLASISRFKALWIDLKVAFLSVGRVLPEPVYINSRGSASVPWGVAFAVGTMVTYYLDPTGEWAGF